MTNKFNRVKSDDIFTELLNDLDNLNIRDGKFDYSDYVTLHNDISALYDSFSHVDEIIESLIARAEFAEKGYEFQKERANQAAWNYQQKCQDIRALENERDSLRARAEGAEAERDKQKVYAEEVATDLLRCSDHCDICKHSRDGVEDCPRYDWDCSVCQSNKCVCRTCRDEDKWEWRGVKGGTKMDGGKE